MNEIQEPTERPGGRDGEKILEHPAFGLIGGSRVSGGAVLFGSDFVHHNFVEIRISRAELHRDLSRDWTFGRNELVSVRLSEAQWATFVSSLNMGQGVPCTIHHTGNGYAPGLPLRREEDVTRQESREALEGLTAMVDEAIAEVKDGIGASLSQKKRDALIGSLQKLRRKVGDSLPFMAKSFDRHMEKTVERAKVEVNAYMQGAVMRAGMASLTGSNAPLQLMTGDEA